jgi:thiol:disulfide interchange protein
MNTTRRLGSLSGYFLVSLFLVFPLLTFAGQANLNKPHARANIETEVDSVAPGKSFDVALVLEMDPEWHTYWKNPGDSGLKTKVRWELPDGVKAGDIQWPYPQRLEAPPLVNFGYGNKVWLLTQMTVPADYADTSLPITAHASWLVCREICIPGKADLDFEMPVSAESGEFNEHHADFEKTRAQFPISAEGWKISAEGNLEEMSLIVSGDVKIVPNGQLFFFPGVSQVVENSAPQTASVTNGQVRLKIKPAAERTTAVDRLQGVLVNSGGWNTPDQKSLSIDVPVTSVAGSAALTDGSQISRWVAFFSPTNQLLQMVIFAFFGGIILNLMPCVFPVLSIKILSFVEQAGHAKNKVRNHGLVFTAGVLASFWLLAVVLIVLRAKGQQLGWGFQLQSPRFVAGLTVLIFLMSLNLLGVFEVGSGLMGIGSNLAGQSGYRGSFFTGVLATIVATPCTAPFMGSAVGFALTQPPVPALLVFTSLGMGMALPYLILSCFPALLRLLPKPGLWMVTLKEAMAFPLFATAIWLVWVFGQQVGMDGVLKLLIALLLIAFTFWWHRKGTSGKKKPSRLVPVSCGVLFLFALYLAITSAHRDAAAATADNSDASKEAYGLQWEKYSKQRLGELQAMGKVVFVDFTAAWCVSCQVNERVVFSSAEVRQKFLSLAIVPMKADWTSGDPMITKALSDFGRSGVPFYLLYGKDSTKAPQILPEVLSPGIVLSALDKI